MFREVRLSGFFLMGLLTTTPLFAPPGDDENRAHVYTRFRVAPPAPDNDLPSGVHAMGTDFHKWDYEDELPSGVVATETDLHNWRREDARPSGVRAMKANFNNLLFKLGELERTKPQVIAPGNCSPQGGNEDKPEEEEATFITLNAPLTFEEKIEFLFQGFRYGPEMHSILVNLIVYGTVATNRISGALRTCKEIPPYLYSLIVTSYKEQTSSSHDKADEPLSEDWEMVDDTSEGENDDL